MCLHTQRRGARDPGPDWICPTVRMYSPNVQNLQHIMVWVVHGAVRRTGPARGPLNVGLSGSVSRLLSWLLMTMVNRIHRGDGCRIQYTVPAQ